MVVSLALKSIAPEQCIEVTSQESDAGPLITARRDAHEEQMHMVGHQAIYRARKRIACAHVQEEEAKFSVKTRRQPAGGAILESHRPVNPGEVLIRFDPKAGEIPTRETVGGHRSSERYFQRESKPRDALASVATSPARSDLLAGDASVPLVRMMAPAEIPAEIRIRFAGVGAP
jgi:hypothetical protein